MSTTRMSLDERQQFLADKHVGVIATRDRSFSLAVPVWYRTDAEGNVVVWTERGSLKERLIREHGRFSLVVQDENPPYRYVSVEGPAVFDDRPKIDDVRAIAQRYLPEHEIDPYLDGAFNERSVLMVMTPQRWYTADFAKVS